MDSLTEEQQKVWDILNYDIMKGNVDGTDSPRAGDVWYDISSGETYTFGGLTWIKD